jgi:hypothetical protein
MRFAGRLPSWIETYLATFAGTAAKLDQAKQILACFYNSQSYYARYQLTTGTINSHHLKYHDAVWLHHDFSQGDRCETSYLQSHLWPPRIHVRSKQDLTILIACIMVILKQSTQAVDHLKIID